MASEKMKCILRRAEQSAWRTDKEVSPDPTDANFAIVQKESGRLVTRQVEFYSLDVVFIRVMTSAERYSNEELFRWSQSASYSKL